MSGLRTPADIEQRARKLGLSINEVCRRAGVAVSIFQRWKQGVTEPNLSSYRRICEVVEPPRKPRPKRSA
jgi:predicted transcriptional regulator